MLRVIGALGCIDEACKEWYWVNACLVCKEPDLCASVMNWSCSACWDSPKCGCCGCWVSDSGRVLKSA